MNFKKLFINCLLIAGLLFPAVNGVAKDLLSCDCDMLFMAKKKYKHLPKIFSLIRDKPILTIGDGRKFAGKGVHIGLYKSGRKIRFAINLSTSKKNGLKKSSKRPRLATEIYRDMK